MDECRKIYMLNLKYCNVHEFIFGEEHHENNKNVAVCVFYFYRNIKFLEIKTSKLQYFLCALDIRFADQIPHHPNK